MIRNTIACASLILPLVCGCSSVPVAAPPKIVEVVKPAPIPEGCRILRFLELPEGTPAQVVIEKQHAVILAYEEQVKTCAGGVR